MIDSMLLFGVRAGNLYIGRTPYVSRPVINITPGTFQGSARAPEGSRPAPLDTVRCPLYLMTKICDKESRGARPFAGRAPYATRRVFQGLFTAYRFEQNAGRIGSSVLDTPAPVRVLKIVPAPTESEGSQTGTVRKWPKYPFLLAVRGPGVICESVYIYYGKGEKPIRFQGHRILAPGSLSVQLQKSI